MSDVAWLIGLSLFFLVLGFALPYVTAEFGETSTSFDIDTVSDGLASEPTTTSVGLGTAMLSAATMFVWNVGGGLPIIINILLLPIRLAFLLIVIRNFPVVGSGGG